MQQDDIPIPGIPIDDVQYLSRVLALPVLRIHRPVDDRHCQGATLLLGQQAVGRAHPVVPLSQKLLQQLVIFLHILRRFLSRQLIQFLVVVGMVAHLMALGSHARHDIRVLHHLTAHHEEGGVNAPLLQAVQQLGRAAGRRAVIEGQGHIFDILHLRRAVGRCGSFRQRRTGAGCQQQQRRQQSADPPLHPITSPQYMRRLQANRTGQGSSPALFLYSPVAFWSISVMSTRAS